MTKPGPPPTRTRPSYRVLLVDDSAEFTELLKQHLVKKRDPSWIVHAAGNYSEALHCLKSHTVDLVVLDINMPVMDGLQFLTMIKRSRPALPVVVLSGMVTPTNREFALQHGASLVLDKIDLAAGFESIYPALEATAEAPQEGFNGMLRKVGLMELLQLECLGRKSSVLEIKGPNADGRIYISEGAIIHAEFGDILGEKALARLHGLKGGEFRLAPFTQPSRYTIDGHWEALLLEAVQAEDEQTSMETPPTSGGEVRLDLWPQDDSAQPADVSRRIEEVVLGSSANDILHEWKAPHAEHRIRLLDWLVTKSSVVVNLLPSLGRAERLEINEPRSRVIFLLQPERKLFVRLSVTPPAD